MKILLNSNTFNQGNNITFKSGRKSGILSKMVPHPKAFRPTNPKKYYFVLADLRKVDEFMTEKDAFHFSKSFIQKNPHEIKDLLHALSQRLLADGSEGCRYPENSGPRGADHQRWQLRQSPAAAEVAGDGGAPHHFLAGKDQSGG